MKFTGLWLGQGVGCVCACVLPVRICYYSTVILVCLTLAFCKNTMFKHRWKSSGWWFCQPVEISEESNWNCLDIAWWAQLCTERGHFSSLFSYKEQPEKKNGKYVSFYKTKVSRGKCVNVSFHSMFIPASLIAYNLRLGSYTHTHTYTLYMSICQYVTFNLNNF